MSYYDIAVAIATAITMIIIIAITTTLNLVLFINVQQLLMGPLWNSPDLQRRNQQEQDKRWRLPRD